MYGGGEAVDRAHRGGVGQLQLLVQLVPNHHVVVVVVVVGGGGEAVRRADRVGGALCGEARHRPQPHNHRVRLLKRPQRVSNLRKLFGPKRKNGQSSFTYIALRSIWSFAPMTGIMLPVAIPVVFLGSSRRRFCGI